ncbi:MAG: diacylglycerol kinase family protein, partial [Alphaproteobacteria bacterium]|nr:diacylglycerol kinase family protein [Alphaproteobacteria bacterium]
MHMAVIFNPVAGARRRNHFRVAMERLRAGGCEPSIAETTGPGDAGRLATALAGDRVDRLLVAGGDGTINEVVNGMAWLASPPELAILPLGTANVLAHEIGLTADAVAETALAGDARPITVGDVSGRRFLLMAGIGLDAHVVAGVDGGLKRRIGKGAYAWSFAQRLFDFSFPGYRYRTAEGEGIAASLVLANARHYGGRHVLAPTAGLEKDGLALCAVDGAGALGAVAAGVRLFSGAYGRREGKVAPLVGRVE